MRLSSYLFRTLACFLCMLSFHVATDGAEAPQQASDQSEQAPILQWVKEKGGVKSYC